MRECAHWLQFDQKGNAVSDSGFMIQKAKAYSTCNSLRSASQRAAAFWLAFVCGVDGSDLLPDASALRRVLKARDSCICSIKACGVSCDELMPWRNTVEDL